MGLIKNKKTNIVVSGLFILVCLVLFLNFSPKNASSETAYYDVLGWAWLGADCTTSACPQPPALGETLPLGWMSLHCGQTPGDDCTTHDYRVQINMASGDPNYGDIKGYAWIGNYDSAHESEQQSIGWVDFNPDNPPDFEPLYRWPVQMETNADNGLNPGDLSGWARIISMQDEPDSYGWIYFGHGPNYTYTYPDGHVRDGVGVDLTTGQFSGYAWAGDPKQDGGLGWINFDNVKVGPFLEVLATDLNPVLENPPYNDADSYVRLKCNGVGTIDQSIDVVNYQYRKINDPTWVNYMEGSDGYDGTDQFFKKEYRDWSTSGLERNEEYEAQCQICKGGAANCPNAPWSNSITITLDQTCPPTDSFCEDFTAPTYNDAGQTTAYWDSTTNWLGEAGIAPPYPNGTFLQSINILDIPHPEINRIMLNAYWLDNGQDDIKFYVSKDAINWTEAFLGVSLLTFNVGADEPVYWKAVFNIDVSKPDLTSRIYKLIVTYNPIGEADIFGWGWVGADVDQTVISDTMGWLSLNCRNTYFGADTLNCHCANIGDNFCPSGEGGSTYVDYKAKAYFQSLGDSPVCGRMWIGDTDYKQTAAATGSPCGGTCSNDSNKKCLRNYECNYCSVATGQGCDDDTDCPTSETCITGNTCSPVDFNQCYGTGWLYLYAVGTCSGGSNDGNLCTTNDSGCLPGTCQFEAPPGGRIYTISKDSVTYNCYANAQKTPTDEGNYYLEGWGRLLSLRQAGKEKLKNDWGWVRLRSPNQCTDSRVCNDDGQCIVSPATECDLSIGQCVVPDSIPDSSCQVPEGDECEAAHPGSGLTCASWCGSLDGGFDDCVMLDLSNINRPTLQGYAWSGGGTKDDNAYDPDLGLGWIMFSPTLHGPYYFQTRWGDIYLKESGEGQIIDPTTQYTATYLIHYSGGDGSLIGFRALAGVGEHAEYPEIDFPAKIGPIYKNALGRLDYQAIINNGAQGLGKYGYVNFFDDNKDIGQIFLTPNLINLNHQVYYVRGNLTVNQDMTILNGDVNKPNAAGLIVVEGNLIIENNISYSGASQPAGSQELRKIASLGWIVKGDVIVGNGVRDLAGAFIILGNHDPFVGEICNDGNAGCGRFVSGTGTNSLSVKGAVMARYFSFKRNLGTGANEPSELINYDGRLLVNTPPGLESFSQGLPTWQEVAP